LKVENFVVGAKHSGALHYKLDWVLECFALVMRRRLYSQPLQRFLRSVRGEAFGSSTDFQMRHLPNASPLQLRSVKGFIEYEIKQD
jgi:hypothetical protein